MFSPAHTMVRLHSERVAARHAGDVAAQMGPSSQVWRQQSHSRRVQSTGTISGARVLIMGRPRGLQESASSLSVSGVATPLLDPFDRSHGW